MPLIDLPDLPADTNIQVNICLEHLAGLLPKGWGFHIQIYGPDTPPKKPHLTLVKPDGP